MRNLIIYILTTLILSAALSTYAGLSDISSAGLRLWRIVAMAIPSAGVLMMAFVFNDRLKNVGWSNFPSRWLIPSVFIIPLSIHLLALPSVALLNNFAIPWQDWLTPDQNGIYHTSESFHWGDITFAQLAYRILLNGVVGLVIVSMLAFFEEIGWRAWMLPRLIQQSSVKKGIIFSAAIWAFWHMPFVLGGMNVIPGMALGEMLLLYPIGLFGAGLFLGWVWYKSQSIWMVSLAHGSLNNWGQYAFKFMRDGASAPHEWPWLYTSVNVAMLLAGVLVLLVLNTEESSG